MEAFKCFLKPNPQQTVIPDLSFIYSIYLYSLIKVCQKWVQI